MGSVLVLAGGCVGVLGLDEEDHADIVPIACAEIDALCFDDGVMTPELVWKGGTCKEVVAGATSDEGGVTADEVGICIEKPDCLEALNCLVDYSVFNVTGTGSCRAVGEPCLGICYTPDCEGPHRCCDSQCVDGVCE